VVNITENRGLPGWAFALSLSLFSLTKKRATKRNSFYALFHSLQKSNLEQFAISLCKKRATLSYLLFVKRATKSDLLFSLLQKEQKEGVALLLFAKRAALSNSLFAKRATKSNLLFALLEKE